MGSGGLTALQARVLELLAGIDPPWTLTGGAALVGFHLHHRRTRDLDLFWRNQDRLGAWRDEVVRRLSAAGLKVEPLHSSDSFQRLNAGDGRETVILDLVAEPVAAVEPAVEMVHGRARIRVDTTHEILVNKLCTLLGRAEFRDLVDLRALLAHGGDLARALREAPRKDGGFSALTLAWILRSLPLDTMATEEGVGASERQELERFRDQLVARVTAAAHPGA